MRKIPWRRAWLSTPVFLPGGSQGQRSLGGYSPQGCTVLTQLKQLRCPSADEWKINCGTSRQCYVIQCSKEEFSSHRKMWKNFKCIVLGERKDFPGVKNLPANADSQEMWVWSLGREDLLEKEMATYCSVLAWKVPWTEEPGGLQSMRSQELDMT